MFGPYIRKKREERRRAGEKYSLRQVAYRAGLEPAYLSKIERQLTPPPSEGKIRRLAEELEIDADHLLALAGKVSVDLQNIIRARPVLFAGLLRLLRHRSDGEVAEIVRATIGEEKG